MRALAMQQRGEAPGAVRGARQVDDPGRERQQVHPQHPPHPHHPGQRRGVSNHRRLDCVIILQHIL